MKTKSLKKYAEIVRLKDEGRTHVEVARMVGCSVGTVTTAIHYSRGLRPAKKFHLRVGDDYLRLRLKS